MLSLGCAYTIENKHVNCDRAVPMLSLGCDNSLKTKDLAHFLHCQNTVIGHERMPQPFISLLFSMRPTESISDELQLQRTPPVRYCESVIVCN